MGLLLSIVVLLSLPGATAHADLISEEPPRYSELESAPDELILLFSETFDDGYNSRKGRNHSGVEVTDEEGTRYDLDNIFEDGNTAIRVPLDPMPDGIYTIDWHTLGTDNHVRDGRYLLAVNVTFGDITFPPDSSGSGEIPEGASAEIAVRTVGFLAGSLAAGISLFVLALPRGDPLDAARRIHHRVTAVAGVAAALASLLLLVVIARRIEGTLMDAADTTSGTWIVLRGAAFAFAGITAWATARWAGNIRRDDAIVALFGLIGLFATAMSGHAASEQTLRAFAIGVHVVHLVAVAFWIGGVLLLGVLVGQRTTPATLHGAVKRFSPLAIAAVVVIIVTGTAATGLRILGPADLVDTVYGRALLVKILLILPLIGLGALNRYWVQPRLVRSEPGRATRRLRQTTAAEVAIMVVILVAASTLTTVAPPDSLGYGTDGPGAAPDFTGIVDTFETAGMSFTLRALPEPLTVGRQNITLEIEQIEETEAEVHSVFLVTRSPEEGPDGEGDNHRFTQIDDETWYLSGIIMPSSGLWHNDLLVQGPGVGAYQRHVPMMVE